MAFGAAADSTASREGSEDHGSPSSIDNKDEHETGSRGEGTMHSEQSQSHHGPWSPSGQVSPMT